MIEDGSPEDLVEEAGAAAASDPDAAPQEPDDQEADETSELRQIIDELRESEDRAKRTAAFYDTRRKQADRELEGLRRFGVERFAKRLLPVVDGLERALAAAEDGSDSDAMSDGVSMVLKQLLDALESEGVTQISAIGQPFDPNLHEAVASQPTADVEPHHVVAEIQKGYVLRERLLRASTVLVAAPIPKEDEIEPETESDVERS
jgi:molecular chaperone GrpE